MSFHGQTVNYSEKMIYHLFHGPSLTEKEYRIQRLVCLYANDSSQFKTTFCNRFNCQSVLNEQVFRWSLIISPYEIDYDINPSFRDNEKYNELLNNPKQLYSFYEFLYNEPSVRLKVLSALGPKISFDDFEKRFNATKNWK